jgi:Cysteine rich repeat
MLKILSTCAALTFLLVSSAMAQSGACAEDIKKACANIEPGKLRIATCLKERVTDLSDVCKARLAEVAAAGKTCRADVEKQCGTESRRITKVACVKNSLNNLGDDCKTAISAVVTRKK